MAPIHGLLSRPHTYWVSSRAPEGAAGGPWGWTSGACADRYFPLGEDALDWTADGGCPADCEDGQWCFSHFSYFLSLLFL